MAQGWVTVDSPQRYALFDRELRAVAPGERVTVLPAGVYSRKVRRAGLVEVHGVRLPPHAESHRVRAKTASSSS